MKINISPSGGLLVGRTGLNGVGGGGGLVGGLVVRLSSSTNWNT